jgi:hypothetical protein
MNTSFSKWRIAAFEDDLSADNGDLSADQDSAKHQIFKQLEDISRAAATPLSLEALGEIIESMFGYGPDEAIALAQEFQQNPSHNQIEQNTDPVEVPIENPVSQEQMMTPSMNTTLNSTVPSNAPAPQSVMSKTANEEWLEEADRQRFDDISFEPPYKEEGYSSEERNADRAADQKQELLDAIEEMIDQVVNTKEIPVENAVLLAAEEVLDVPVSSIEELDSHFPGLAEKVRDMISRANSTKEMQDARGLAENDPDEFVDRFAKYPGHHNPGDKKHLKGEGPKNEKANEIYHAIMRDKDIKGEPSEEDKSSAAAIAWSQAEKSHKKKKEKVTYFRGEEAEVLDTYRDMWGTNISRIRVQGSVIEVPQETLDFKMTNAELSGVEQLIEFVEGMPKSAATAPEIEARTVNLKSAVDQARAMLLDSEKYSYSEQGALNSIYMRCASELEGLQDEDRLITVGDLNRVSELPTFELGKEILTSSFTQHSSDWLEQVAEEASSHGIDDVDKFVREDPLLMVSELPESIMSDAGAVRTHAKKRVASAAAYLDEDIRHQVVSKYLDNAENARRSALQMTKIENSNRVQRRQASVNSVPDEGLFL